MSNFNKVILMGRLSRDVELKSVNNGISLVELGVAVNERRKSAEGTWKEDVHFIDVTFWGKKAEVIAQYLTKGDPILLEGRLKQNRWEVNGKNHSRINVYGEQFSFVGSRQHGSEVILEPTDIERGTSVRKTVTIPDDDIPF